MTATPPRGRRRAGRTRRRTTLAVLTAAGLVAVACSKPPTTGSGDVVTEGAELPECPLDALEEAEGTVEVTLWYGGIGGIVKQTMEGMVSGFNASQDRIRVTASDQGASYNEVFRKYESAASAGSGLPEIVYFEDVQLQALADAGTVLPAQSCMEADGYDMEAIEPAIRSAYTLNGALYPGYMNVSTPILYYNKAHWAQAGLDPDDPPGTLDEIYEQARALKDAGVSDKPFVLKLTQNFFKNWLNGLGVEMVNNGNGRDGPATAATFATDEARELLEFLRKMNDEGLVNVFSSTEGGIDHYLALVNQQSSMIIETSTASTTIRDALQGQVSAADAGVDFDPSSVDLSALVPGAAPFPGVEEPGQVIPGGGVFYILNASEPAQQAGSWEFLEFMLQPENAKEWHLNGGYLPVITSVQDDPEVQAFWEDDLGGLLLHNGFEQLQNADPNRPGPLIGPHPDFARAVERAMEEVLLDGRDVDDALDDAQQNVTQSLERYAGS